MSKKEFSNIFVETKLSYKTIGNDFFSICKKLKEFPYKKEHPKVEGLYFEGYRFFDAIRFSKLFRITLDDIKKINGITPIIDKGIIPYSYKSETFKVNIPIEGNSFKSVKKYLSILDQFLKSTFPKRKGILAVGIFRVKLKDWDFGDIGEFSLNQFNVNETISKQWCNNDKVVLTKTFNNWLELSFFSNEISWLLMRLENFNTKGILF